MIPFSTEEAMKSGVYISGTTGTGKSDIGMYQAEELMREGVIVIVFDPSQDWITRSSIRGYAMPKMDEYLWNGYIPQRNFIFDLSQLTIIEQQGFVEDFCKKLIEQQAKTKCEFGVYCDWKPKQYYIIFEEAQIYFPQGYMMSRSYRNTVRMMTQGRNFGVRFCCITQFASMIDKKAMRYMRQRYFGYTDEPNDTEYILKMFPKEFREQGTKYLMGLKAGQFIYKCGNAVDQFEIAPFQSETKPQPTEEIPQKATIVPLSPQNQNTGSNGIAIARLMFLTIFAMIFLWIIANAKR